MARKHLAILFALLACSHRHAAPRNDAVDGGTAAPPVDRLLPGELAQSKLLVFGFPIPQGMTVDRRFADSVYMVGTVSPEALTAYVKAHAVTGPAELIGNRKVFSKVKIRGADPSRLYNIEIDDSGSRRRLIISDVTPPPLVPGLSVEERWRRAGYNPDGTPLGTAEPR